MIGYSNSPASKTLRTLVMLGIYIQALFHLPFLPLATQLDCNRMQREIAYHYIHYLVEQ